MAGKTNRTEIADNIFFSAISGNKFKTDSISVKFIVGLDEKTAADNNIAFYIISSACADYPTRLELNRRLTELYGASLGSSVSSVGDYQVISLSCSCIDDAFALDNEEITAKLSAILMSCLFSPVAKDGEFDAELFRQLQKEAIEDIEAEINNKRSWAINRAVEIAYEGQPYSVNPIGTKQTALASTPKSAYEAYRRVLETARVEIIYCGCGAADKISADFAEAFGKLGRHASKPDFSCSYMPTGTVRTVSEPMDVNQCKLVMVYKTQCEDRYALGFMNCILGATPFSKLFANVREKLSLCYYCASRYNKYKNYIRIDSGVNPENLETARIEINRQLTDIAEGKFTDADMENSLLSILDSINSTGDTASGLMGCLFRSVLGVSAATSEEEAELFRSVTRERIENAAKALVLDTVYIMQVSGSSDGEDAE